MTVAHFFSSFRSHLAQVMVPLRVLTSSFLSSAWTETTRANAATNPASIVRATRIAEPPLCKKPHAAEACETPPSHPPHFARSITARPAPRNRLARKILPPRPAIPRRPVAAIDTPPARPTIDLLLSGQPR